MFKQIFPVKNESVFEVLLSYPTCSKQVAQSPFKIQGETL